VEVTKQRPARGILVAGGLIVYVVGVLSGVGAHSWYTKSSYEDIGGGMLMEKRDSSNEDEQEAKARRERQREQFLEDSKKIIDGIFGDLKDENIE
jgi:hypothetical protein